MDSGKKTAQGSFLKYTAHEFKKLLLEEGNKKLTPYKVKASNKEFEFWQRDSLAIPLYSAEVAYQKLDYLHYNPLADRWKLASDTCQYKYRLQAITNLMKNDFHS